MLRDGEVDLQAPEQDEARSEGAPPGAREAGARDTREEVAGEEEFECVGKGENQRTGDERVGKPIVIKRALKFAVQEVISRASGAAKDAGQPGNRPARGREREPVREGAGPDEREQKERGWQEREMERAPMLFARGEPGRRTRIHQTGGRVSWTGGTGGTVGGGGGSVGLTTAQTS